LGDVLHQLGRSRPAVTASVCGDTRLTYADLDRRANRVAHVLASHGLSAGDRVVWLGQNCHRVLELLLAAARLGAVLCPANWRQTPNELAWVLDDLEPTVVVWQEQEMWKVVDQVRAQAGTSATWIRHDGSGPHDYEARLAESPDTPPTGAGDIDSASPVLGIGTAAFGGRPQTALISHEAIIAQDLVVAAMHHIDTSTIYLNCGPLFHIGTLMSTLATFHCGGTNVYIPKADAELICQVIERERVTRAFIVEPTRQQIVDVVAARRYDISTLRGWPGTPQWNLLVTADPSPWGQHLGGYGQTETMGHLTFRGIAPPSAGEHGRTSPVVELRILDDDGAELRVGEIGEIAARGPLVMNGYHARPGKNTARQGSGWHRTHDLGRREADGSITFVGPKARMLKSGVENIYPGEVEARLNAHPAVREAAVIGTPDPVWVQSVRAIVVLHDDMQASEADLIEFCRLGIASYKKPKSIVFVDALPRSGMLVDYDLLDERFGGGGYPGGATRAIPAP
jgi:long-chain acyl-CoA synthetase